VKNGARQSHRAKLFLAVVTGKMSGRVAWVVEI
jgi:hypothetical protein